MINNASFDGRTTYKINYTADICNPPVNYIIQCKVVHNDKSQVICHIDSLDKSPLEIYLSKHNHVGNIDIANIPLPYDPKLHSPIILNIKIIKSKWEYKSTEIICIGEFVSKL